MVRLIKKNDKNEFSTAFLITPKIDFLERTETTQRSVLLDFIRKARRMLRISRDLIPSRRHKVMSGIELIIIISILCFHDI